SEHLESQISELFALSAAELTEEKIQEALTAFGSFKDALNRGQIRAASRDAAGQWQVHQWVKRGILLGFRLGGLIDYSIDNTFRYFDKDTFPTKRLTLTSGVRVVPGGSTVRDGAYLGQGITIMPPAFINAGAYVDDGTMVDSHALIGSCAQVGKRCHISAAAQIGGVLEPVGALPVIIEDDVLVGGNCGVYEGTVVKKRAVLGTGTILNRSTPVYDLVREQVYSATDDKPLIIPEAAVVVAGSRAITRGKGA